MNPDVKAKWLAALRSGERKQGKKKLRCRGKYCCLGVLMDVIYPKGWKPNEVDTSSATNTFPDEPILRGRGISLDRAHKLASMNDKGFTFNEIADYIEANL